MKLRRFKVQRYRCLKEVELAIDDFMAVLGQNNSGKSTLFQAIALMLSSSTRGLDESAFFRRDVSQPIVLEACFDNLTFVEEEALRAWIVDGRLRVRKEYALDEAQRVSTSYSAYVRTVEQEWLREEFADYSKRDVVSSLPIAEFLPASGRITREIYRQAIQQYCEKNPHAVRYCSEWLKNPTGFKQAVDRYLPELHFVPALHDVADETRAGATGLLGKLIAEMASRVTQSNPAAHQQLEEGLARIRAVLDGAEDGGKLAEIVALERDIQQALAAWDVTVSLRIDTPDVYRLFHAGTALEIDDGLPTPIERKGHGLQRSLLFALIQTWATQSTKASETHGGDIWKRSAIFALEEPEVFLHPHMCRALYEALKAIARTDQVMLCTHSSHFVHMDDYSNLVLMRKQDQATGSRALRVATDLFEEDHERRARLNMIGFFNPDRSEIFFASKVVLVEGMTEKAVLPVLAKRLGIFNHSVSIVDCGGKGNLTLYMRVLNAFEIPYLVVHDRDGKSKAVTAENKAIAAECDPRYGKVHMVIEQVEDVLGIPRQKALKLGKAYAAVEYLSRPETAISPQVESLVREAFTLPLPAKLSNQQHSAVAQHA